MEKRIKYIEENITSAVKAANEIDSNIRILQRSLWSLENHRIKSFVDNKDVEDLLFKVKKIREESRNILDKAGVDFVKADYDPAYCFKDPYEAVSLVFRLHISIKDLDYYLMKYLEKEDGKA